MATLQSRCFYGQPKFLKPNPIWEPHQRPLMPGSPSTPLHSNPIRLAYALVAVLVGLPVVLATRYSAPILPALPGAGGGWQSDVAQASGEQPVLFP